MSARRSHAGQLLLFRLVVLVLAKFFDWRDALVIVRPETLLRWHRSAFMRKPLWPVFVVVEVGSRRILHYNVTQHPVAEWTTQQFREFVVFDHPYHYAIHARDAHLLLGIGHRTEGFRSHHTTRTTTRIRLGEKSDSPVRILMLLGSGDMGITFCTGLAKPLLQTLRWRTHYSPCTERVIWAWLLEPGFSAA